MQHIQGLPLSSNIYVDGEINVCNSIFFHAPNQIILFIAPKIVTSSNEGTLVALRNN